MEKTMNVGKKLLLMTLLVVPGVIFGMEYMEFGADVSSPTKNNPPVAPVITAAPPLVLPALVPAKNPLVSVSKTKNSPVVPVVVTPAAPGKGPHNTDVPDVEPNNAAQSQVILSAFSPRVLFVTVMVVCILGLVCYKRYTKKTKKTTTTTKKNMHDQAHDSVIVHK